MISSSYKGPFFEYYQALREELLSLFAIFQAVKVVKWTLYLVKG